MSLRFMSRAEAWASAPAFAQAALALQRAHLSESPRRWETPPDTAQPGFEGLRVLQLADLPARIDRFVPRLARSLALLMQTLGWQEALAIPLAVGSVWAGRPRERERAHAPLRRAREALREHGLGARFDGALVFTPEACREVLPLWFWSSRCGAQHPGIAFGVPDAAMLGSLCQHGNLHLDAYDSRLLAAIDLAAPACGWTPLRGPCTEPFGRRTAIAGRGLRT